MRPALSAVFLLFASVSLISHKMSVQSSPVAVSLPVARYDHFKLWQMHIETEDQLQMMLELEKRGMGIDFIGHVRKTGQSLTILVPSHLVANIADLFKRCNLRNNILLENIQENIDEQQKAVKPKDTKGAEMDWDHYYQLDTLMDYLQHLSDTYSFITLLEIGHSYEGRPIRGIKIAKDNGKIKSAVFVEGGIHAREWISPATSTYLINQLLTSTVPEVQDLLNDFDWFFFPVTNPDGYAYTYDVDRLWRKNRKPYGLYVGVDLNRNFNASWGGPGSSTDPSQFDFAGSGPNSEPEVKVLSDFLTANRQTSRIDAFISLHSYSQLIMFPYGHTEEHIDNYDDLKAIGEKAKEAIKACHGKDYEAGSIIETIYPSSGGSMDWVAAELAIKFAYTVELRGDKSSTDMFILPADQITPVGEEMTAAFVAMFKEAKARDYFKH